MDHMNHDGGGGREVEETATEHHHGYDNDEGGESALSMMMMRMYFHFGFGDQLLFKSFIVDSNYKLLSACLLLCLAAFLNEAIKRLRLIKCNCEMRSLLRGSTTNSKLSDHEHDNNTNTTVRYCCSGGGTNCGRRQDNEDNNNTNTGCISSSGSSCNRSPRLQHHQQQEEKQVHCEYWLFKQETGPFKLIQVILHTISQSLGLLLMLAAMSFNVCLIFAILLGSTIGSYVFYNREPSTHNGQSEEIATLNKSYRCH